MGDDGLDALVDMALEHLLQQSPDGIEEFHRILAVMPARQAAAGRPARLRVLRRALSEPQALRHLRHRQHGVFLQGATNVQARQWAQRLAQRLGGRVREEGPHLPGGLPHFHVDYGPRGQQSTGHIFYGQPPRVLFFEEGR